jgi:hypothetical protein
MNDILRLSVGGQLYVTTRATLCAEEGSMLAKKFIPDSQFAPPTEIEPGIIFVDRNPATFDLILDYLRNGCRMVARPPSNLRLLLRAEADYFGLVKLVEACDSPAARPRMEYETAEIYLGAYHCNKAPRNEIDDGWTIKQLLHRHAETGFMTCLMEREI